MPENNANQDENAGFAVECPNCGKDARIVEHLQEIPHFGKIIISTLACEKCNYKLNDVMIADAKEPASYKAEVTSKKDLETKVIRSSTGTIRIDALGISIEPGPAAEGYITNIEGILERAEESTKVLIANSAADEADESKLARKELERIKKARNVEIPFSVIIEDPFGNSTMIGGKAKKMKLSPEEIKRLQSRLEELDSGIEQEKDILPALPEDAEE